MGGWWRTYSNLISFSIDVINCLFDIECVSNGSKRYSFSRKNLFKIQNFIRKQCFLRPVSVFNKNCFVLLFYLRFSLTLTFTLVLPRGGPLSILMFDVSYFPCVHRCCRPYAFDVYCFVGF